MIYPDNIGLANIKEVRLRTLEAVWIQGKLRMWGNWSHIGGGHSGNMFNHLLASKKITKTALKVIQRKMKKSGISQVELEEFWQKMMSGKYKSHLAFCTDTEALVIDRVISDTLNDYPAMIGILHEHYTRKKSKRKIAEKVHEQYPEWHYETCRNRVDMWIAMAEYMLYPAMKEKFVYNRLHSLK